MCLLAIYGAALAWSSYASNRGLGAMREARVTYTAESTPSHHLMRGAEVPQAALGALPPDMTNWSQTRRTQYGARAIDSALPPAVLRIPSLRLEIPVYAGTSTVVLNRGAGLIEGTALPGSDDGNIGIAAHRDGFFRPLQGIRAGDELYIDTVQSTRRYRVTSIRVVAPQNVSVLDDTARPSVTLVTCYPFHFVGAAPRRFIVRAELAD